MHTKDMLAAELRKAGLNAMADKAATGWYHDFLSPLAMPETQLASDLKMYAESPMWPRKVEAQALLDRHMAGAFDASKEESAAWAASPEGRDTMGQLTERHRPQPTNDKTKAMPMGRLAIRQEGDRLNAYYAETTTMKGAMLLGSIHMAIALNEARRQAFIDLMREGFGDITEQSIGARPIWPDPQLASDSEPGSRA